LGKCFSPDGLTRYIRRHETFAAKSRDLGVSILL
jgi:hypothetical protein